jgi:tungstate transport system ATP-binding protein
MAAPLYCLRNVRVEFAGRHALHIGTLDIERGRVTALVGANGAGKTTLLRVLAFLLAPAAGAVEFDGAPVVFRARDLERLRRQVTLVGQTPLLFRRSVRRNVEYGLRARGQALAGRVEAALAQVGLSEFAERPAWKLSGGESQRVALARALAIDPLAYLFDEPTANVDREHASVIERLIAALAAAGSTVVLTTHDLDQAYRLGESVLSLVAGRITAAPLVNVLRGTTSRAGGEAYFDSDGLRIEVADGSTPRAIAIGPEDILVSREPLHSSARNSFAGTVVKVQRDGAAVIVTVDCGRPLVARITQHSYLELGLNIGTPVWVTFKSLAIHVLSE